MARADGRSPPRPAARHRGLGLPAYWLGRGPGGIRRNDETYTNEKVMEYTATEGKKGTAKQPKPPKE